MGIDGATWPYSSTSIMKQNFVEVSFSYGIMKTPQSQPLMLKALCWTVIILSPFCETYPFSVHTQAQAIKILNILGEGKPVAVIQKIHRSRNIKILIQAMKGLDATSMFTILKPFFFSSHVERYSETNTASAYAMSQV